VAPVRAVLVSAPVHGSGLTNGLRFVRPLPLTWAPAIRGRRPVVFYDKMAGA